jgi:hypothetical protein|nr:MAG TPA: hypothetical protein [Caudoviricetes sp.]
MDFSNLNATREKMKANPFGKMAYDKAKEKGFSLALNSFLGTAGAGAYGIALAYPDQVNKFFQSRYGFKLFEDADRCKINDIPLEWVHITSDDRSSSVKTHSLEDRDSTLISSNVSHGNRKYNISVLLTQIGTENPEAIYAEIVELWQKKELCTISTNETIEDMIITKVSRNYEHQTAIKFEIDFEVLEFAYLMKKGQVLESEKTILKEEQKTGVAGTKNSGFDFWGFLK